MKRYSLSDFEEILSLKIKEKYFFISLNGNTFRLGSRKFSQLKRLLDAQRCVACQAKAIEVLLLWDNEEQTEQSNREGYIKAYFRVITNNCSFLTVDHIIPKSLGGKSHLGNLQVMCERCNRAKGLTTQSELNEKWKFEHSYV